MNHLLLDSVRGSRSSRIRGRRGVRGGYVMLIAMILMAVLAVIGATSLSIAGVDQRIAVHNMRHMTITDTANAGTEHARYSLMFADPVNEGWDTATAETFVTLEDADPMFEGISFPVAQGNYWVDADYLKCSNPPPGYSTEAGNTAFRSDFWNMTAQAEFMDSSWTDMNPTRATVMATLRKVVPGGCKIR